FIVEACASQTNVYVPSMNVTVQVSSPVSSMEVASSTFGPLIWKLCSTPWSTTWMSYAPGSRCLTAAPLASFSEIVNPGPTAAWSVGLAAAEPEGRRKISIAVAAATSVSGISSRRMEPGYADPQRSVFVLDSRRADRQEHEGRAHQERAALLASVEEGARTG